MLLRPYLHLASVTLLIGCQSITDRDTQSRITGVTVSSTDRRNINGTPQLIASDTIRSEVGFWITTHAETEQAAAGSPVSSPWPGVIVNPTIASKSWLSVDRPIRHLGVSLPADTNLLSVEAIRNSFDGSHFDLLFPNLSPFAIVIAKFRPDRFSFERGPHLFRLRWESASGDVFRDSVQVYLDIDP